MWRINFRVDLLPRLETTEEGNWISFRRLECRFLAGNVSLFQRPHVCRAWNEEEREKMPMKTSSHPVYRPGLVHAWPNVHDVVLVVNVRTCNWFPGDRQPETSHRGGTKHPGMTAGKRWWRYWTLDWLVTLPADRWRV